MTTEERTDFLEEYAARDYLKMRAVMVYWSAHPEHMPPNRTCPKQARREQRGLDPQLDPLRHSMQVETFSRAHSSESMFNTAVHDQGEDLGPRNELPEDDEVLLNASVKSWSDGRLRGLGRCLVKNCMNVGHGKLEDGK